MKSRSRTLIVIACAGAGLAVCAWILVRPGSRPETAGSAEAPPPTRGSALSKDPKAQTPPEREIAASSLPTTAAGDVAAHPRIRGLVLDAATGAPIGRFDILHSPAGEGRAFVDTILGYENPEPAASTAFEDAHGSFALEDLGSEAQSLAAFAEGYERSEPVTASPEAGGEELVIRLSRAAVVRGRVVDPATGAPVEGALIGWIDYGGRTRTGPRERFERTDALGRFALGSVPFSARRILAGREDLGEGMSERLEFASGESAGEIAIELRRSGS